jgi:hypothetical protein
VNCIKIYVREQNGQHTFINTYMHDMMTNHQPLHTTLDVEKPSAAIYKAKETVT